MYHLRQGYMHPGAITVVGCGGTGGFVAEGLCRMLAHQVKLILVDHDRIEPRNLLRQNFYPEEVGQFKAEALATRLARQYQRAVGWSPMPFGFGAGVGGVPEAAKSKIIVGCVDNAQARQNIEDSVSGSQWWVDSGNAENSGQVLIGNAGTSDLHGIFDSKGLCHRLPYPTVQEPSLLSPPPAEEIQPMSCAELVDTGDQDPTINQAMSALVLQVVRRLLIGDCPWMALYLDLQAGTLTPVLATPENVARITGLRRNRLMRDW